MEQELREMQAAALGKEPRGYEQRFEAPDRHHSDLKEACLLNA